MGAAGADVAADLGELVDGHEDAVVPRVLEVQVVARDRRDRLGVEAGEAGDAVVLVDDDVAGAQVGEDAQAPRRRSGRRSARRRRRNSRCSGMTARCSAAAMKPSRSRASAKRSAAVGGLGPARCRRASGPGAAPRLYAARSPSPRRARTRRWSRYPERTSFSSSGSASFSDAGGEVGGSGRGNQRLVARDAGEADRARSCQRPLDRVGRDVQGVGVGVVEGGAVTSCQWSASAGADVLLAGDQDRGVARREVEERVEAVSTGRSSRDVRAVLGVLERRDLGELAVLRGAARPRARSRRASASPSERWVNVENQRSDSISIVEQVDAHGVVLGRRVHVEDAAADRELAAVVDLVDALVAGGDEIARRSRRGRSGRPCAGGRRAGAAPGRGPSRDSATALTTTTGARRGRRSAPPAARRAPRRAGRRGAGAARGGTRRRRRGSGSSGRGAAPARCAGRRRGRGPGGRRRRRRARAARSAVAAVERAPRRGTAAARARRTRGRPRAASAGARRVVVEEAEEGAERHGHAQRPRAVRGRVATRTVAQARLTAHALSMFSRT